MVRTVKNHHEEDEEDDEEFSSRTPDGSSTQKGKLEEKSNDGKVSSHRSKHSETEQRRRIKINERFQTLRDLIPESDQKRDRASFMLEVIQYIQFLQAKLQMYEEANQGWSAEPLKLLPWRSTPGPVEGSVEHSQIIRNGTSHEDDIAINPTMLANAQNSVEANLTAAALYRATPNSHMAADEPPSLCWPGKKDTIESEVLSYGRNYLEEMKFSAEEIAISHGYTQRLLNVINQTLASVGVDPALADVRVQLDISKRPSSGATATVLSSGENYDHAPKRPRTEGRM